MKLEIANIVDCEVGEVVKAARGDSDGHPGWALVSEATDQQKQFRGLLWLERHDGVGAAVHINYSSPLLRTHAKLQVETALENISIGRRFPNIEKAARPYLIAVGHLFGFFCREVNVQSQSLDTDDVLVTLDGKVKTFADFPNNRNVLGFVDDWSFNLAGSTDIVIKERDSE